MVAYIIINLRDSGFSQSKGKVDGERQSKTISKKSTQKSEKEMLYGYKNIMNLLYEESPISWKQYSD